MRRLDANWWRTHSLLGNLVKVGHYCLSETSLKSGLILKRQYTSGKASELPIQKTIDPRKLFDRLMDTFKIIFFEFKT